MELFFLPGVDAPRVYVCAWVLGCFYSHISTQTFQRVLTASVDSCAEIECPFSGVTKSGTDWRKVPESDAWRVQATPWNIKLKSTPATNTDQITCAELPQAPGEQCEPHPHPLTPCTRKRSQKGRKLPANHSHPHLHLHRSCCCLNLVMGTTLLNSCQVLVDIRTHKIVCNLLSITCARDPVCVCACVCVCVCTQWLLHRMEDDEGL